MRIKTLIATTAASALLVTPAFAAKEDHAPKGKAYGAYCKAESKQHVAGAKGTPFSQCVTALAKLHSGEKQSAKAACKALPKQHVKGAKGTPFSLCIKAAAQMKKAGDAAAEPEAADTPEATETPAATS
jgi:hypothetical protein